MKLIDFPKNPPRRDLLLFGALLGPFLALAGCLFWWRDEWFTAAKTLFVLAAVLPALYFAIPPLRKPCFIGAFIFAYPIGLVISTILMCFTYYCVLTPTGLFVRAFIYDPMSRKRDPHRTSYWIEHVPPKQIGRYFRQF